MNKILGLDLGTKTIGIAISDALLICAHGYENYVFGKDGYKVAINHILEILDKENINEIVIGLPLNMDGSKGPACERSEKFKEEMLKIRPNLNIEFIDERLTTVAATRILLEADLSREKRKKVIDKESAVLILDTYLAKKKNQSKK